MTRAEAKNTDRIRSAPPTHCDAYHSVSGLAAAAMRPWSGRIRQRSRCEMIVAGMRELNHVPVARHDASGSFAQCADAAVTPPLGADYVVIARLPRADGEAQFVVVTTCESELARAPPRQRYSSSETGRSSKAISTPQPLACASFPASPSRPSDTSMQALAYHAGTRRGDAGRWDTGSAHAGSRRHRRRLSAGLLERESRSGVPRRAGNKEQVAGPAAGRSSAVDSATCPRIWTVTDKGPEVVSPPTSATSWARASARNRPRTPQPLLVDLRQGQCSSAQAGRAHGRQVT